jgi:Tfp pilus assembly ATPase PilU
MQTFDQHLLDLVGDAVVTYETALAASSNPKDFELQTRTLRRRARAAKPAEAAPAPAPAPSDDLSSMLPP